MLTVWGRANSSNVQKVMWLIGELGLEHKRIDAGHMYGKTDTADYRAMNPQGLVPTLVDGDLVLPESNAILRYLIAREGATQFYPSDPKQAATVDRWVEFAQQSFLRAFVDIFWLVMRTKPSDLDRDKLSSLMQAIAPLSLILDQRLAISPFIAVDHLSLADFILSCQLYRYYTMDLDRPERPHLAAYYHRLTERPAYRQHVMVDYLALQVTT